MLFHPVFSSLVPGCCPCPCIPTGNGPGSHLPSAPQKPFPCLHFPSLLTTALVLPVDPVYLTPFPDTILLVFIIFQKMGHPEMSTALPMSSAWCQKEGMLQDLWFRCWVQMTPMRDLRHHWNLSSMEAVTQLVIVLSLTRICVLST